MPTGPVTVDVGADPAISAAEATRVVVAICTHRRPDSLLRALRSVAGQDEVPGVEVAVCVIDNTSEHQLRERATELSETAGRAVDLVHEPRLGRPVARNTAVRRARELGAAWLAFMDDDEIADPDWLRELVRVARTSDAAVVCGNYVSEYPGGDSRLVP